MAALHYDLDPCPWCHVVASVGYSPKFNAVMCTDCGCVGPQGANEADAVALWNDGAAEATAPADISIEETPELSGARMVLRFRTSDGPLQELVVVEFVHEDYIATMRGALTLIGGMRQAEEAEEHG
jgi:hypothetical protein